MMKKHAMLIMAHNQFEILEKLMRMLDHERNDIYIHIDKKSKGFEQAYFEQICEKSKVIFIQRRRVYWGHSSIVDCELRLLETALNSGEDYEYLHLLSGTDLQIKKTEEIHRFFDMHPDKQFVALRYAASGIGGMSRYYFFLKIRSYNKYIGTALDLVSAYIQRILKINRLKNMDMLICKTQQWFSITNECAAYVVGQKEFIKRFTRFSCCADEMFLGTVIVNSEYKNQIYEPYRSPGGHMRLIDRDRAEKASPHTWTMEDWNAIKNCPYFWARKFDLKRDIEVIEKVYNTWK